MAMDRRRGTPGRGDWLNTTGDGGTYYASGPVVEVPDVRRAGRGALRVVLELWSGAGGITNRSSRQTA